MLIQADESVDFTMLSYLSIIANEKMQISKNNSYDLSTHICVWHNMRIAAAQTNLLVFPTLN